MQIQPADKLLHKYQLTLREFRGAGVEHESATRSAFQSLLADLARRRKWQLIPEHPYKLAPGSTIRPDATLRDDFSINRGYWEAKDTRDDLETEIRAKTARGYPESNIIYDDTARAILIQNRARALDIDLRDNRQLATLLTTYFNWSEPAIQDFESAVESFKQEVPNIGKSLAEKVALAHHSDPKFKAAFAGFYDLCREALNPNLRPEAVDEMLVQHLLTERLIRRIFDLGDFDRRNVIAHEVEKVIDVLAARAFSRSEFLRSLDKYYVAIERAADTLPGFSEKQHFLNTIYERFFQGYCVRTADTHGIVYTPQPIVDYMCATVAETLESTFGRKLGDPGVTILDPCTGTGNFIVNLIHRIHPATLPDAYQHRLFANEVMLMPYYIASLNIERAYFDITQRRDPFPGLCFVDTLDLRETPQASLFSPDNSRRVETQIDAPINVIIGNPPYNVGQQNENDNNKNRKYLHVDQRVRDTYGKASKATNKNSLADVYVKFFRWATDRLRNKDGIVCFVSNNSFVDQLAFDGMRKHLGEEFTFMEHIDLHGNVRQNPKLSGTTHNVFGIQVGVGITLAVRHAKAKRGLRYHRVPEMWRKEEKLAFLERREIPWQTLTPNAAHTWIVPDNADEFETFTPITEIFDLWSSGVKTNRDDVVYDFQRDQLETRIRQFISDYNAEVDRYKRAGKPENIDAFVSYDHIKWSRDLKLDLRRGNYADFAVDKLREAEYRPFTSRWLFFDRVLNEEVYQLHSAFPANESTNRIIWLKVGSDWPMFALATTRLPDLLPQGGSQCFPLHTYSDDGHHGQENIKDSALALFRTHYADPTITKEDLFHYIYAVLHHATYRDRFAANLKKELPRIPFAPAFRPFAEAGKSLMDLHIHYESVEPWPLEETIHKDTPYTRAITGKMKLSKDRRALHFNEAITLHPIPPEVFDYKLGNRSALEWLIDQYQIKGSSNPNRAEDPDYIFLLVQRIVSVSIETQELVKSLPALFPPAS